MIDTERSLLLALKWWVAEKDLADDLAKVLDDLFDAQGRHILEEDTPVAEVVEVLARYKKARGK